MEAAAKAAAPAVPSPLYKPLHELTEDDIAQVTREDCRRFLKEKGMRRPSWNKSQAIQQVISLKALLEAKPNDVDDDGDVTVPSPKRGGDPISPPVVPAPPPPPPPPPPAPPPPPSLDPPPAAGGVPSRLPLVPVTTVGPQMTIFYDGAVNVYDAMPVEQAVAIMKAAATQDALPEFVVQMPVQANQPIAPRPPPMSAMSHLPLPPRHVPSSVGMLRYPHQQQREGVEDWRNSRDVDPEGPAGRRASLQRYLEKRKDRCESFQVTQHSEIAKTSPPTHFLQKMAQMKIFKCKRGIDGLAPSDFELFLSQKVKPNLPLGQQYPHDTISFTHPLCSSTPTQSYFIENQGQTVRLSIDLNNDDVQEV